MNICLVNKFYHQKCGGIETYTHRMAMAFAKRGHTVHIVTTAGEEKFHLKPPAENVYIHKMELKKFSFPGYWRLNRIIPVSTLYYHFIASRVVDRIVQRHNIDIVEVPDFEGFRPMFGRNFPVVIRFHGFHGLEKTFMDEEQGKPRITFLWKWSRSFFNSADAVVAVSRDFADAMAKLFSLDRQKILVSHLSVDQNLFYPAHGASNGELSVLFVGRHEASKGVDILAEAVPQVAAKVPSAKFLFIGRDTVKKDTQQSYRQYLKEKLQRFNVEFIDSIPHPQLAEYYRKSTVGVFPSLYEPGGTVALEAIACGCPVIVTKIGCFPEYFHHKEDSLLVPAKDNAALADAIVELLQDRSLRERIRTNALHLAQEKFSLDAHVTEIIGIYEKAIKDFHRDLSADRQEGIFKNEDWD